MSTAKRTTESTVRYIEVLEPLAETKTKRREVSPRLDGLENKSIGFLDNTKPNADILLAAVADLMTKKYRLANAIQVRKEHVIKTAGPQLLESLAERCDAVITASGD